MADARAVGVRVLPLRTKAMGIRFRNGNANRVTVNNFFPWLWNLVDNQLTLNWQSVTCRQQSNVQVRGPEFGFGLFITQSLERWNSGSNWSGLTLTLYVQTEC